MTPEPNIPTGQGLLHDADAEVPVSREEMRAEQARPGGEGPGQGQAGPGGEGPGQGQVGPGGEGPGQGQAGPGGEGPGQGQTGSEPSSGGLLAIFLAFLRLGVAAFGGPAMVAYIRELAVGKKRWLTGPSFGYGVAVCQSIPGATAMQAAAYVGLRRRGPFGAMVAFLGFGLPSFLLMVGLTVLYVRARDLAVTVSAFKGLAVIVVAIVANATWSFGRSSIKGWKDVALALAAAAFLLAGGGPVLAILGSAVVALLLYQRSDLRSRELAPSPHRGWLRDLGPSLALLFVLVVGLGVLFFLNRRLFDLSALMAKVDLFAFGGGYASVPLMHHEVVAVRHWMDSATFMDGIAMGQITPGPIVITATFVGYLLAGIPGAVLGTIGVFTPSLIILMAVVPYFDRLGSNVWFQKALRGAMVSFVGLLLAVTVQFAIAVHWGALEAVLAAGALVALRLKVDILWVVLAGAGLSILLL